MAAIGNEALNYTQGCFINRLESEVPDVLRAEMSTWGLCTRRVPGPPEDGRTSLTWREVGRMIGAYVVTQATASIVRRS